MPELVAVGVDVGSSSARSVAVDREGSVSGTASVRYAASPLPVGEADPAAWLRGAVAAVAALEATPASIGFTGLGPTTVASSGERALTFRHPATAADDPEDQHSAQAAWLRDRAGDDSGPRLLWDWIATQIGARGDVQSLWPGSHPLEGFGETVPAGASIGTTSGEHGLPSGILLAAGADDARMATWGCGIERPGMGIDPGGRTGGLGVAVSVDGLSEATAYSLASAVPGVAVVGGPTASHGAMLDWWARITGREPGELLVLAADVPPGALGVAVLPFLEGERAPRWNPGLRAEIIGLHASHDVAVVTRAMLEASAYGLGHIARSLSDRGIVLERLVCCGGPSRSRLWNWIKAAVLEVPVEVPALAQMSAYGAALSAGAAAGWWPRPGEGSAGSWPIPEVTTVPSEPLDVYREGLDRYIALGDAAEARLPGTGPED